jgi:hypothetical protein
MAASMAAIWVGAGASVTVASSVGVNQIIGRMWC